MVAGINLPRLDPCQIDNTQCTVEDFDLGDETTCHTTSNTDLNWNVKKCIGFIQYCADIKDIGYENEYNRIRCNTDEAPAADPTKHVPADVEDACKRWRHMEYCQWNWLNMGIALVFVAVVGIGSLLVCTKKGIRQQQEEERDKLLRAVQKAQAQKERARGRTFTHNDTIKF